ncbi:pyruvate dehydrogenase complex E1 component subunit beta, partial [Litorisediminicola beolgyonensis]
PRPAAPRPPAPRGVSRTEPDWPADTALVRKPVREALREALTEEMARDDTVLLMGESVGEAQGTYKISQGLLDRFGGTRVLDTPVTEAGFAGLAVGAAWGGLKPVVEFMSMDFALQAMDQIVNSAAKTHYMSGGQLACPIVFRGPDGAAARVGAQHAQSFAAWLAHVPGLKVASPYCASDAKGLLKSAIRDPNPVILLENETLYGKSFEVPDLDDYTVPFGKARRWRSGDDVTLVSYGPAMEATLEAADRLAADGIAADVLDLRSLRPLDEDAVIESVTRTHRCVTIEEGWPMGAIGAHLAAVLMREAFDALDAPVAVLTGADVPMPYAEPLEAVARVTADAVVAAASRVSYA